MVLVTNLIKIRQFAISYQVETIAKNPTKVTQLCSITGKIKTY